MTRTIEVFTLSELKNRNPGAYNRVRAEWESGCASEGAPWSEEIMDSLRAVVDACGGKLHDWSIGAYSPSSLTVRGIDDDEQDRAWFLREVLAPNGYTRGNGHAYFPGNCKLTGYCADDDFLGAVWKDLCAGSNLTDALEGLAVDASRMMEDSIEQEQSEESMIANWGEDEFTIDGVRI